MEESTLGPIAERYGLLEPLGSLCSHPAPPGEVISEIMSSKVVGRLEQKVGQIEAETAVAVVQEFPSFDDCLSS
ncbi:hypothetical protein G6F43_010763 [Rhizopus delemar]|nr:hypothetical protein G6F43_010763 [Rhizopus delemar]